MNSKESQVKPFLPNQILHYFNIYVRYKMAKKEDKKIKKSCIIPCTKLIKSVNITFNVFDKNGDGKF